MKAGYVKNQHTYKMKHVCYLMFRKYFLLLTSSMSLLSCSLSYNPYDGEYEAVQFVIKGQCAEMSGAIDNSILEKLENLTENHQVKTIVMIDVPGSLDDEANLEASEYIRSQGFNTHLPAHGVISSGGTDFFLAGVQRSIEKGAKVGVHSWAAQDDDGNWIIAQDIPKDDESHQMFLDYYKKIGISEDFYWFTLDNAIADDMYWMSWEEMQKYSIFNSSSLPNCD